MNVNPTGAAGVTTQVQANSSARTSLGQDAFFQLLVTQLRNQNPTDPQDSQELISQLATFSSLEKLTHIDETLNALALLVAQQQAPSAQGGE